MAGTGSNATFIPEVWAKEILAAREANLVMANHVMRLDAEVKTKGDTIHIPTRANQTARTKVAGTTVAFVANTEGEVIIGVTTQAYLADIIEDMAKTQSQYDLMRIYTEAFGYGLASKVDSDLLTVRASAANTVGVADSNTPLSYTMIIRATRYLDSADAPKKDRYMIVDPVGYEQLLKIDNFVRYDATGHGGSSNPIDNGRVGKVFGVDVFESTQVSVGASYGLGLMWQKDFMALAMQKDITVKHSYSPRDIGDELVVYNIYGYGVTRSTHGVQLRWGMTA